MKHIVTYVSPVLMDRPIVVPCIKRCANFIACDADTKQHTKTVALNAPHFLQGRNLMRTALRNQNDLKVPVSQVILNESLLIW